jgi:hypothetical protein
MVEQVLVVSQTKGALASSRVTKNKLKPESSNKGFLWRFNRVSAQLGC